VKDDRKTTGNVELTEEDILTYEISDEALEAASGMCLGIPTLANTYCFTCPTGSDN